MSTTENPLGRVVGHLSGRDRVIGHLSGRGRVTGTLNKAKSIPVEQYAGSYEFTPGETTQTISIAYKQATSNITINPIPENYGRIAWDGTSLTVW